MAASSILPEKLHEYPQQDVIDGSGGESAAVLDDCLNHNGGVLPLIHRYAGRTFCSPGKRLRLSEDSYHPDYMGGTGLDEVWRGVPFPSSQGLSIHAQAKLPIAKGNPMFSLPVDRSFLCRI